MTIEKPGDPVFKNVDAALAEKIISRSRENCAGSGPVGDDAADSNFDGACGGGNRQDVRQPEPFPLLKIAAVIVGALVLMMLIFGRGGKRE